MRRSRRSDACSTRPSSHDGALTNTLVSATPLAFTGLAAAVAFRMRPVQHRRRRPALPRRDRRRRVALVLAGTSAWLIIPAMIVAGAACGAAWGAIPGVLRAFAHTNEIITSLMLNYVAALVLNYLIFDSLSYWRDTSATGQLFPQGKALPDAAAWPTFAIGSVSVPVRVRRRDRRRDGRLGAVFAHPVRLRDAGDRRLARGRAVRRACGRGGRSSPCSASRVRSRGSAARARTATSVTCSTRAACSRRTTATPGSSSRRSHATTRSRRCWSPSCSADCRTPATRCRAPTSRPASSA